MEPSNNCPHNWKIPEAPGPGLPSIGVCDTCGEEKEFQNGDPWQWKKWKRMPTSHKIGLIG